jgi:hypothetical protein
MRTFEENQLSARHLNRREQRSEPSLLNLCLPAYSHLHSLPLFTNAKNAKGGGGQLAERAYHPDEVRASGGQLVVDVEYYLANQVCGWEWGFD